MQRSVGQGGTAVIFVQLWQAFGWFGASGWDVEDANARWPAITASLYVAIAAAQNLIGWWRSTRNPTPALPT